MCSFMMSTNPCHVFVLIIGKSVLFCFQLQYQPLAEVQGYLEPPLNSQWRWYILKYACSSWFFISSNAGVLCSKWEKERNRPERTCQRRLFSQILKKQQRQRWETPHVWQSWWFVTALGRRSGPGGRILPGREGWINGLSIDTDYTAERPLKHLLCPLKDLLLFSRIWMY